MRYEAYRQQTVRAASANNADVTSLAGGYVGITFRADGAYVVIALDLDANGAAPWLTWTEAADGEHCCDANACELGVYRPSEYPRLREDALAALLRHVCR